MKKGKRTLKNKKEGTDRHTEQKQRRQSADLPAQNHFTALHEHGLEAQNNLHPGSKGTTPFEQEGNNLSPIYLYTPFSFTASGWNSFIQKCYFSEKLNPKVRDTSTTQTTKELTNIRTTKTSCTLQKAFLSPSLILCTYL